MIEFLPDCSEKPHYAVYKILFEQDKRKKSPTSPLIGKGSNYDVVRSILQHCPENTAIKKQARAEIEGIFDYITYGTFNDDKPKEKVKLVKKLIRLSIIAF